MRGSPHRAHGVRAHTTFSFQLLFAGLVLCGPGAWAWGRRAPVPVWVKDPTAVAKTYPLSRYLVGIGVCGGASNRDIVGRQEAEKRARADIAAYVEVQIKDTLEMHDSEVRKNGRSLVQNVTYQTTKRVVSGVLSGTEIKETYYDRRTMTWHALAVLERVKAGRGTMAAVEQRIGKAEQLFDAMGNPDSLADYVALRGLEGTLRELDWLALAVAMFTPNRKAAVKAGTDAVKQRCRALLEAAAPRVAVFVAVEADDGTAPPKEIARALARVLKGVGIPTTEKRGAQRLHVAIALAKDKQVGAVRLTRVTSGCRYTLQDGDHELVRGRIKQGPATSSRASSYQVSRSKSLAKLRDALVVRLGRDLRKEFGLEGSE